MRYHVSIIHETGHLREYDVFPGSLLSLPDEIAMPWSDFHAPRTDAPVRFIPRTRHPALLAREGFNPGSFTIRWA